MSFDRFIGRIKRLFWCELGRLKNLLTFDWLGIWRNRVTPPEKTVLDYDWNYLIIIDACRHDLFEEVEGESNYIISNGSCTGEWRDNTFTKGEYEDIVYISGNPIMSEVEMEKHLGQMPFHHLEKVYLYGWDKKLKATPLGEVTKAALKCVKKYPDKKMIIHYLQPHYSFIGEKKLIFSGEPKKAGGEKNRETVWQILKKGKLNKKEVWKAYKDNLELVMGEVNKLKKQLDGKVVLTSDHGNCVGEYQVYGHPVGIYVEELVKVPWDVIQE